MGSIHVITLTVPPGGLLGRSRLDDFPVPNLFTRLSFYASWMVWLSEFSS